jgi:predicted DNA-binding WGR domain protein
MDANDIELRLIDPSRNRFRVYALTECRTLFGERCLRMVWGRMGTGRLRERSEIFETQSALERRRNELLARRRRHGYEVVVRRSEEARRVERDLVEAHGLPTRDISVQQMVSRWHLATLELSAFLRRRRREEALDLVDVSTLAAMYVDALAS